MVDLTDDLKDIAHNERRKAERRLVHHNELRACHERAAHSQHLLLTAGKRAARLPRALAQAREKVVYPLDIAGDVVAAEIRADLEIFEHREIGKNVPSLRDERDAFFHDGRGVAPGDVVAAEVDRAAGGLYKPGDRAERRAFARAVRADERYDLAFMHIKGNALDGFNAAVVHAEIVNGEDLVHSSATPRYASITFGSSCTTAGVPCEMSLPKSTT